MLTISGLTQIPQVILLSCQTILFYPTIDFLIKKIICLGGCRTLKCVNCQKLEDNNYFDLKNYKLNSSRYLKKQDTLNIINDLSYGSVENNNPKICVIEQIEYATLEASNAFLKFLENPLPNTYIILVSSKTEQVLPTIKSRCQILTFSPQDFSPLNIDAKKDDLLFEISNYLNCDTSLFTTQDVQSVLQLVEEFITNDNKAFFDGNFLLVKQLVTLRQKSVLFFYILLLLTENKLITLNSYKPNTTHLVIEDLVRSWGTGDKLFLSRVFETSLLLKEQFNPKTNLNLLFNYFFITIYQGEKYGA